MQRRRALQVLGSLAALPTLGALSPSELLALGTRAHETLGDAAGAPRSLSPAQYRVVTVAAEHIIPRTDTPGATDARVADFVEVILTDWYTASEREAFLDGVNTLDARAKRLHGRVFADCPPARRLPLLTELDNRVGELRVADPHAAESHWFAALKTLTVWGYYTSRVGIVEELRDDIMPGRYDGDAPYEATRAR